MSETQSNDPQEPAITPTVAAVKSKRSKNHSKAAMSMAVKIESLISLGLDNKQVFLSVVNEIVTAIENDSERKRAAEEKGMKDAPPFIALDQQRLEEFIRRVRHTYNQAKQEEDRLDSMLGRGTLSALDDLNSDTTKRLQTFNDEIDWLYDGTPIKDENDETLYKDYGLPVGKISLWAGERGVGKTRTTIQICGKMNKKGKRIIVIQGEVALSEYKQWTRGVIIDTDNFWVSDQVHLDDQISTIKALRPDLVVVDSLNMIREARTASGMRTILTEYKRVARLTQCHVIFIGHLNKNGGVKGNNDLEYLVDIVVHIRKRAEGSNEFALSIPDKNRYGCTGREVWMMHNEDGVDTISTFSKTDIALARAKRLRFRAKP